MNRVLLMDKEEGITSFDLIRRAKKEYGRKVGHAGTLDKFASGLMIVLAGSCTRLCETFMSFGKEYIAHIEFGRETDTLDPEGVTVREAPLPSESAFLEAIKSFRGEIDQVPPQYSAIHVNGRRAYREARSGNIIEMPSRKVTIESLDVLSFSPEGCDIRVSVSKGTYIRSLARDIALASSSAGYLTALRRLRIGPWTLEDRDKGTGELLRMTGLFSEIRLDPRCRKRAENGYISIHDIVSDSDPDRPYAFISFDSLFAIGGRSGDNIKVLARVSDEDL